MNSRDDSYWGRLNAKVAFIICSIFLNQGTRSCLGTASSCIDENSEHFSFEYTWPITTIFCTRHDSDTVVYILH